MEFAEFNTNIVLNIKQNKGQESIENNIVNNEPFNQKFAHKNRQQQHPRQLDGEEWNNDIEKNNKNNNEIG